MLVISMSAVWVKISTILCLCYTAETKGIVWKEPGQSITIQCRIQGDQALLTLKTGINEDNAIVTIYKTAENPKVKEGMGENIQTHGVFPNKDILIKNLNESYTGPYWCVYTKMDTSYNTLNVKGNGSVLLVVSGKRQEMSSVSKNCEETNSNMVAVYAVIALAALLIFILGFVVWSLQKTKNLDQTVKARHVAQNNDVYEDMRGTLRR